MTASRFCFRASCRVSSIILASALLASAPGYAQIGQSGAAQAKLVPRTSIMQPSTTGPASSQALGAFLSRTMVKPNLTRVNTGPGIVYTCDPSVATATCNYLNTTVAGYYNATFTNANANIYVQYGSTGLGESQYYFNYLTYTQYATAYGAIAAKSPIQTSADTALSTYDATPYGSDYVWIQPGIARALGATSEVQGGAVGAGLPALGINTSAGYCTAGTTGCYDGLITVTNSLTLYYDNLGGSEPAGEYDFYAVVEHETDEVLGTSSCISTQGTPLSDACDAESGGSGTPSAVDLFRYSSAGNLVLDSSLSTATGAYFSYDGGSTNGAKGIGGSPKFYNTLDNGADYADYALSSPCAPNEAIQDAYGCPGEDGGLTILNDGGSEINILTAVGYQVPGASACTTGNPNPNPNPAALVVPADFNGDCKSDILWRNSSTGQLETWLMNGTALASQGSPGTVSTTSGWSIQATGDFDGDGKSDVLWQNSTTGQVEIWLMNGTTLSSQGSPGTVPSPWTILGVGDFDGDGKSDILWRNSTTGQVQIWLMNGTTLSSQGSPGTVPSQWNVLGIGDFNGDGKADILWQNTSTGQVQVWLMNGTALASQGSPGTVATASDWVIQGVGDFNGDGKSDILWRNSSTGLLEIWLMNGTALTSEGSPGTVGSPWVIQGVGDFNGDGKSDILWQNSSTGQVQVWLMNGTALSSQGSPGTAPTVWQIAIP